MRRIQAIINDDPWVTIPSLVLVVFVPLLFDVVFQTPFAATMGWFGAALAGTAVQFISLGRALDSRRNELVADVDQAWRNVSTRGLGLALSIGRTPGPGALAAGPITRISVEYVLAAPMAAAHRPADADLRAQCGVLANSLDRWVRHPLVDQTRSIRPLVCSLFAAISDDNATRQDLRSAACTAMKAYVRS